MHEYILKFIIIREFVATKKYETKSLWTYKN